MAENPRCIYCGFDDHPLVFAEHDCPDSMGYDAASFAATEARRALIKPPAAPSSEEPR